MKRPTSAAEEGPKDSENRFAVLTERDDMDLENNTVYIRSSNAHLPSIKLPVRISTSEKNIAAEALVDSGANTLLIHKRFAQRKGLPTRNLSAPIKLINIDGTPNIAGIITQEVRCVLTLRGLEGRTHIENIRFLVTDTGDDDLVLGMPWIKGHNPSIDWETATFTMNRCKSNTCRQPQGVVTIIGKQEKPHFQARATRLESRTPIDAEDTHPEQEDVIEANIRTIRAMDGKNDWDLVPPHPSKRRNRRSDRLEKIRVRASKSQSTLR